MIEFNDETWLPVPGYEDLYEVSNRCEVRKTKTGRILVQRVYSGRKMVTLYKDGQELNWRVKDLVDMALDSVHPLRPILPGEIWKEIKGYEGIYWISNLGRVKTKFKIMRSIFKNNKGYYQINFYRDGSIKSKPYIHRLVAEAFVPNPDPEHFNVVNHIDEIRTNNNATNLEWTTQMGNMHSGTVQERLAVHHLARRNKKLSSLSTQEEKDAYIKSREKINGYVRNYRAKKRLENPPSR